MRYSARHWSLLALAQLSAAVGAAGWLLIPYLLELLVDQGISLGDRGFVLLIAGAIIGASAAVSVGLFTYDYLAERVNQLVGRDLRNELFARYQNLSFAFHDRVRTGQLMSRLKSDVESVMEFCGYGIGELIRSGQLR